MRLNSTTSRTPDRICSFLYGWRRNNGTRFSLAINRFGLKRCSVFDQALLVGVSADGALCQRVSEIPAQIRTLGFMDGPRQIGLIKDFLSSPEAQWLQHLHIGVSPKAMAAKGQGASATAASPWDLSRVVRLFRGNTLPMLRTLSVGDCFLFGGRQVSPHMGGCALGDISPLVAAAPKLELLDLTGPFRLDHPLQHSKLREISIQMDCTHDGVAEVSQQSFSNLLFSNLPRLQALSLVSHGRVQHSLSLPKGFNPRKAMPQLMQLDVENLNRESAQRQAALQAMLLVH